MKILYTLCSLLCLLSGCKETRPEEKAYNVLFIHAFHKGLTAPQGDILTPQEEANFSIPAYHIEESLAGIADAFKDNDIPLRLKDSMPDILKNFRAFRRKFKELSRIKRDFSGLHPNR